MASTRARESDHVMSAPPPRAVRSGRAVIAAAATLALGATACGGGNDAAARATPSATPVPPHVVRFCSGKGSGWRGVKAQSNGEAIDAAALGAGPVVVLVNESDNNACAWMAEARALAERGEGTDDGGVGRRADRLRGRRERARPVGGDRQPVWRTPGAGPARHPPR